MIIDITRFVPSSGNDFEHQWLEIFNGQIPSSEWRIAQVACRSSRPEVTLCS